MTSQIRVDEITNRSGLGTVTIYDNGFEFTGVTTFTEDVDITGGLTIGGVLTYEDVTNIDSVGVVTARGGLDVSDTGTPVNIDSTNSGLNKIHFKTGGTTSGYLGNNSTYFFSLSDSSGNQRVRHANSGLYQVLDTSGNVIHQMSGTGKIGIGTAPVGDLTVLTTSDGYVDINGSGGNGAEIRFLKKSDRSQTYTIQNNGGANELAQHVLASTSGQYSWYIGGQSTSNLKLRIDSAGKLSITGSTANMEYLRMGGNNDRGLRFSSSTGSSSVGVVHTINAPGDSGAQGEIVLQTNSAERLRITSGGQSKFTVGTNKYVKIYAASHNDEADLGAGIAFSRPSDGADMLSGMFAHSNTGLGIAARDHITFLTGGTSNVSDTEERLRITSTGLVGIGTNSPSGKLNIFGSDSQLLNLVQDSGDLAIRLNDRGVGSAYIKVRDNTSGSLSFDTGGSERLRITSGGITEFLGTAIKMPVGTSDPGSAATGWAYYNSSNAQLRIYDGSTWGGLRFSTKGSQTNPATSSSDLSATGSLAQYYFSPDGGTAFQNYACGGLSNLGTIPSGGPSWVSTHSSLIMIVKGQVGQTSQYVMSQANYLKFVSESISRTTNTPYIYWAVFDSGTLWGITRTRWTGATYSSWASNHDWDTGEPNPPSGTVNWDVWKTGSGTTGNTLATGSYTVSNSSSLVRAVLPQQDHNNAGTAYGIHYKRTTSGEHYPWFNSSGNCVSNGYFLPSGTYNLGTDTRYVHYIYLADS